MEENITNMTMSEGGLYVPEHGNQPAREIHQKVVQIKADIERNFIKLGAYLKLMHDDALYVHEDCLTWNEYLDMPEVDLSRSQAYKLMAVYERWVERYGHDPEELIGTSLEKLYIASSQANEENEEEWLEKAKTLSRADLKAETPGNVQKKAYIYCPKCEHLILLEDETIVYK